MIVSKACRDPLTPRCLNVSFIRPDSYLLYHFCCSLEDDGIPWAGDDFVVVSFIPGKMHTSRHVPVISLASNKMAIWWLLFAQKGLNFSSLRGSRHVCIWKKSKELGQCPSVRLQRIVLS